MTDRERLIGLIMKARAPLISRPWAEEEADYLIQHGVIVPPCKVGDIVYFLDLRHLTTRKLEVIEIKLTSPKAMLLYLSDGYLHGASDFGTSLFYTEEEVDEAIKRHFIQKGI